MEVNKTLGWGAVVFAVAALGYIFMGRGEAPLPQVLTTRAQSQALLPVPVADDHRGESPSAQASLPVPTASSAAAPRESVSAQMRDKFARSTNLSAFIRDALADPSHGGKLYALLAYSQCRQVAHIHMDSVGGQDTPEISNARAALSKEISRCDGVLQQWGEDAVSFGRQVRSTAEGVDILLPPDARGMLTTSDGSNAAADFAAAQASGDPNAVAAVLQANLEHLSHQWFGTLYDPARESLYYAAGGVVACELRADCASPLLNAARCAFAKDCRFTDYRDFVLATYTDPAEREAYAAILKAMRERVGLRPGAPS